MLWFFGFEAILQVLIKGSRSHLNDKVWHREVFNGVGLPPSKLSRLSKHWREMKSYFRRVEAESFWCMASNLNWMCSFACKNRKHEEIPSNHLFNRMRQRRTAISCQCYWVRTKRLMWWLPGRIRRLLERNNYRNLRRSKDSCHKPHWRFEGAMWAMALNYKVHGNKNLHRTQSQFDNRRLVRSKCSPIAMLRPLCHSVDWNK